MSVCSTGLEDFKTLVPHLGRVRQTLFQPISNVPGALTLWSPGVGKTGWTVAVTSVGPLT